ncbi:MAG: gluconate 2-dehydrogenase subunit 3 family protein [Chromatiaceae bacterium]|jgi:gluconate 2-dehydrogenase gamma chain|nr:gluconate 2-dehydrogenase subunit 3 family protein [Chromatiaceae bacterium]
MIRRSGPCGPVTPTTARLQDLRDELLSRRRFLIQAAGGTVTLLFGLPTAGAVDAPDPWATLDAVTRHLLPSEPDSPGAVEIRALDYLRFVVDDVRVDPQTREFILQGTRWLDDLAEQQQQLTFAALSVDNKEDLLRQVAATQAGENWISTLLTYLFEALLSAPAYGGNPDGIGWRWLEIVPGFPLPGPGTRYPELPL